jgi:hypothetical protein
LDGGWPSRSVVALGHRVVQASRLHHRLSPADLCARMRSLRFTLLVLAGSASALVIQSNPTLRSADAARASSPTMINGFLQKAAPAAKKGGKVVPTGRRGKAKAPVEDDPNKLLTAALALPVLGAGAALPVFIIASVAALSPGTQTPFDFLDPFFPPRVAELKAIKEKKDAAEAKIAAEKKKADDAAKAKKEAEEKAAKEAAAKEAAAKAATEAAAAPAAKAAAVAAPAKPAAPPPAAKPAPAAPAPVAKAAPAPAPVAKAPPAPKPAPAAKPAPVAKAPAAKPAPAPKPAPAAKDPAAKPAAAPKAAAKAAPAKRGPSLNDPASKAAFEADIARAQAKKDAGVKASELYKEQKARVEAARKARMLEETKQNEEGAAKIAEFKAKAEAMRQVKSERGVKANEVFKEQNARIEAAREARMARAS